MGRKDRFENPVPGMKRFNGIEAQVVHSLLHVGKISKGMRRGKSNQFGTEHFATLEQRFPEKLGQKAAWGCRGLGRPHCN